MFGNFGIGMNFGRMKLASESIEKKLKDPNTEVEDLLREEDLLQELRSQNEKLIDYFDRNKIKRLIDYIIKEPEVDEQEKGYKFPFICSQIFGLELDKMIDHFFVTNKQLEEEKKKNEKKEEKNEVNEEKSKDKKSSVESANNEKNKELLAEQKEKADENNNKEDKKEEAGKIKEDEAKDISKKDEENKENKDEAKVGEKKEEVGKMNKDGEKKGEEKKVNEGVAKEGEKKEETNTVNKNEIKDDNKEEEKKVDEGEKKDENKNVEKNEKEGENGEENNQKEKSEENRMELLDQLFSFFPEKEEDGKRLNYVLCGYFSSIIINLLSINPTEFLKYIYNVRSDIFYKMVNHCYRKSISDTLSKILHFENYFQSEDSLDKDTKHNMEEKRKEILNEIFQKIDINKDNEDLNSIYFLITGLFDQAIEEEKLILKNIIDDRKNMKALLTKPLYNLDLAKNDENVENKRKNFMIIIDIVIFLLTTAKKLKLDLPTNTSESINHTELSKEIFDNLDGIIKNIFNKKIENQKTILQSFNEYQLAPLGEYKIKVIDLLLNIIPYFKNISKSFDEKLINTEFFKNAFNYLYEYEWNNIYQESLLSLLKSLINDADNHQLIQEYLFNKLNIIESIKTHTNSEDKYKFNTKDISLSNPISHGYYSFFISLSYKINTALGGTPVVLKNNTITRQGSFSFMAKPPENAMNSLYGFFGEDENNGNEGEKEEEKYNYETMKKYINDDWRLLFGNISEVIQQYENRDWPEEDKKDEGSSFGGLPGQKEADNQENNGESDKEKNIMKGEDNNANVNESDGSKKLVEEEGNNKNDENSTSKEDKIDGKDSGTNDNDKKVENKQKENELENEGKENKKEEVNQVKETEKIESKGEEKQGDKNEDRKKEEDENKKDEEKKEENKGTDKKEETKK